MPRRREALGFLALTVLTFAVTSSGLGNGFLNWDDIFLLHMNLPVRSFDIPAILGQKTLGIYHPVTLLSVAVEHRFFGLDPRVYHLTNSVLHVLATLLVAVFLRSALRDAGFVPFAVAALFGVHPLHVESAAWVAERKDLLSTVFILLTLLAYLRYADSGRRRDFASALGLFTLALLSKPMAVTIPVLMLALDHWRGRKAPLRQVLEKLPFFALAGVASWISLATQAPALGEASAVYEFSILQRIGLGTSALAFYISKTILPLGLSAYYDIDLVRVALYQWATAGFVLSLGVIASLRNPGKGNDARLAMLFFLVSIAPVLKVVPFGGNSIFNDRYMYLPSVGLLLLLVLPLRSLATWPAPRRGVAIALCSVIVAVLSIQSFERARVWRDSETFWNDVLAKYPDTAIALSQLGRFRLDERNDAAGAAALFERAVRARPEWSLAHFNLGLARARLGEAEDAAASFRRALERNAYRPDLRFAVGSFHLAEGNPRAAAEHFEATLVLAPRMAAAEHHLGLALLALGDTAAAKRSLERAIALEPEHAPAIVSLADVHYEGGNAVEALPLYERAAALGASVDRARIDQLRAEVADF